MSTALLSLLTLLAAPAQAQFLPGPILPGPQPATFDGQAVNATLAGNLASAEGDTLRSWASCGDLWSAEDDCLHLEVSDFASSLDSTHLWLVGTPCSGGMTTYSIASDACYGGYVVAGRIQSSYDRLRGQGFFYGSGVGELELLARDTLFIWPWTFIDLYQLEPMGALATVGGAFDFEQGSFNRTTVGGSPAGGVSEHVSLTALEDDFSGSTVCEIWESYRQSTVPASASHWTSWRSAVFALADDAIADGTVVTSGPAGVVASAPVTSTSTHGRNIRRMIEAYERRQIVWEFDACNQPFHANPGGIPPIDPLDPDFEDLFPGFEDTDVTDCSAWDFTVHIAGSEAELGLDPTYQGIVEVRHAYGDQYAYTVATCISQG